MTNPSNLVVDVWTLASMSGGEFFADVATEHSPPRAYLRIWFAPGTHDVQRLLAAPLPQSHPTGLPQDEWDEEIDDLSGGALLPWDSALEMLVEKGLSLEAQALVLARES